MLRNLSNPDKVTRDEWSKYSVNGIECERDAIYQTIMDHHFYTGKVELNKKYHFQLNEEKSKSESTTTQDDPCTTTTTTRTESSKHNESKDRNSNFSLGMDKFAEKVGAMSDDLKQLIEKMIHALDMYDAAQDNHSEHSQNLRAAIKDCMSFLFDKLADQHSAYNDMWYQMMLENFALLFDLTAFGFSKVSTYKDESRQISLPNVNFDTSSIKEQFDEGWSNRKKSEFMKEYLAVMLNQADVIRDAWMNHYLFTDQDSQALIQSKFDDFKKVITSLQEKKAAYDATLSGVYNKSPLTRISAFFYRSAHHLEKAPAQTQEITARPKQ